MRRANLPAVTLEIGKPHVIRQNENDIRPAARVRRAAATGGGCDDQRENQSNPRVAPDLEDGSIENNPFLNGAAIAINIEAFGNREMFEAEAERLGKDIAVLPRADGVDKIMLPGERGACTSC